jgi:hypothetical protein
LTAEKSAFNYRLSRDRRCVECAFGILCDKWRILTKYIETDPVRACAIIKAACMLHNFVRQMDHTTPHFNVFHNRELSSQGPPVSSRRNNSFTQRAKCIRIHFTDYFKSNPINSNGWNINSICS